MRCGRRSFPECSRVGHALGWLPGSASRLGQPQKKWVQGVEGVVFGSAPELVMPSGGSGQCRMTWLTTEKVGAGQARDMCDP